MKESPQDMTGRRKPVKLSTGQELTIETPKLGFYYDFVLVHWQGLSARKVPVEKIKEIAEGMKKGKISESALAGLPNTWLDFVIDLAVYFLLDDKKTWPSTIEAKRDWAKEELFLNDLILILEALLEVEDFERILGFFVKINRLGVGEGGVLKPPTKE